MSTFLSDPDLTEMSRCVELPSCHIHAVKPHNPINFPKIWFREQYVESFEVKCRYWTFSWKQFRQKKMKFFFLQLHRAWTRVIDYRMYHVKIEPDQIIAQGRSIDINFLSMNIDSTASWKKKIWRISQARCIWGLYLHYWKFFKEK